MDINKLTKNIYNIDIEIDFIILYIITILFKESCITNKIFFFNNYECINYYFDYDIKKFYFKHKKNNNKIFIQYIYNNDYDEYDEKSIFLNNKQLLFLANFLFDFEGKIINKFIMNETKYFLTPIENNKYSKKVNELLQIKNIYNCKIINYLCDLFYKNKYICNNVNNNIFNIYTYNINIIIKDIETNNLLYYNSYCSENFNYYGFYYKPHQFLEKKLENIILNELIKPNLLKQYNQSKEL